MALSSFCTLNIESELGRFGLFWLYNMSPYLSEQDGFDYMKQFEKISKRDLDDLREFADADTKESDASRFFHSMYQMQLSKSYHIDQMFLASMPLISTYSDKKTKNSLQHLMAETYATDRIYIDMQAFQTLFNLWQHHNGDSFLKHVPIDLVMSQRIMIPDMEICLTNVDPKYEGHELVVRIQYLLSGRSSDNSTGANKRTNADDSGDNLDDGSDEDNDDTRYRWHKLSDPDPLPVALIDVPLSEDGLSGYVTTFGVMPGVNQMLLHTMPCVYGIDDTEWNDFMNKFPYQNFVEITSFFMQVWYTICVCQNCAFLKSMFEHPTRIKDRRKCLSGIKCVKITRPLRIHKITAEAVDQALSEHLADTYDMQYLIGGWFHVSDLGLDCVLNEKDKKSDDIDVMMIPSGWYQFDKKNSKPIDWLFVRRQFALKLYNKVQNDGAFTMDEACVTQMLLDLLEGIKNE